MENCKERIVSVLRDAGLSAEDLEVWETMVGYFPEELCPDVLRFLEMSPENIGFMTESLRKKKAVAENFDEKKWDEILAEDVKFLRLLAPNLSKETDPNGSRLVGKSEENDPSGSSV
ncbi:MAG: hypothetical protein HGA16_01300 [Candidatus Moranbacteria bacterium]|nr:hypothetical protein [Candidatus Moranbacteria bacterium]